MVHVGIHDVPVFRVKRVIVLCYSLRNMRHIARELGENLGEEELQAMIDEFDKDGDGEISENEFLSIMKQTSIYWTFALN